MPPIKAAKKAAKKAPGHPDPKKPGKDMRRAYEHLGRVRSIIVGLPEEDRSTARQLVDTSEQVLRSSHFKEAADLLRAAEHLAFASLQQNDEPDTHLSAALLEAVHDEYQHLCEKAADHGDAADAPVGIGKVYKQMRTRAKGSFGEHRYRAALELARGAEALAHIGHLGNLLPDGGQRAQLKA